MQHVSSAHRIATDLLLTAAKTLDLTLHGHALRTWAQAQRNGWTVVVSVLDDGGNLVFLVSEGAWWPANFRHRGGLAWRKGARTPHARLAALMQGTGRPQPLAKHITWHCSMQAQGQLQELLVYS